MEEDFVLPFTSNRVVVTLCYIDFEVAYELTDKETDEKAVIHIGGRFFIKHGNESVLVYAGISQNIDKAVVLFNKLVNRAIVFPDGTFEVKFSDGYELLAPYDPDYEAWGLNVNLNKTDMVLVISMPGGGVDMYSK